MKNQELNQLQKDVIDILSNLCESVNETDYRDYIPSIATMDMNNSGSYTCNTYKAKESLLEYQKDYSDLITNTIERYGIEFGMNICEDYFKNPEKFQVLLLIELIDAVLYRNYNFANWVDEADKVGDIDVLESIIGGIIGSIENNYIDFNNLY